MAIPKETEKQYFTYAEYKGTPSFEIFPNFKLDLLKVFGSDEKARMHARAGTESRSG